MQQFTSVMTTRLCKLPRFKITSEVVISTSQTVDSHQ